MTSGDRAAPAGPLSRAPRELTSDQVRTYEEAARRADLDAVHDVIARHGLGVLDFGVPYVVVAARNQARSAWRKTSRTQSVSSPPEHQADQNDDPLASALRNEQLRAMVGALAHLDDMDLFLLWEHAKETPDARAAELWHARGGERLSTSAIRKRRQRARERLRSLLGFDKGGAPEDNDRAGHA